MISAQCYTQQEKVVFTKCFAENSPRFCSFNATKTEVLNWQHSGYLSRKDSDSSLLHQQLNKPQRVRLIISESPSATSTSRQELHTQARKIIINT